jgi:hypothetical protein
MQILLQHVLDTYNYRCALSGKYGVCIYNIRKIYLVS